MSKQPFWTVLLSHADPALDPDAMLEKVKYAGIECSRLEAFVSTRDPEHLVYISGKVPVKFHFRPLSAREVNSLVRDLRSPSGDELWTLCQRCLTAVDNDPEFMFSKEQFKVLDPMKQLEMLRDDAMDLLAERYSIEAVRELGATILASVNRPASAYAPFASLLG